MGVCKVFLFACIASGALSDKQLIQEEHRLNHDLFVNYSREIRPVQKASDAVPVTMGVSLQHIVNFDETKQVLSTSVWISKTWKDVSLQWDPSKYDNITEIRIPAAKIWKPDIILYNSASDKWEYAADVQVVVSHDGSVIWVPPTHLHSTCAVDLTRFPFDSQICMLKFGSWTNPGQTLDLTLQGQSMDTLSFIPHTEWALVTHSASRNVVYYACCPEKYLDITFKLTLRRRSGHYSHTLMAPSVVLAFLIPFVFLIPPGSPGKIQLGTGVLLGLILLALLLYDLLPPGGRFLPLLSVYNISSVILTAFSLALATVVNMAWCKRTALYPVLYKIFVKGLGRILCIRGETLKSTADPDEDDARDVSEWQQMALVLDRLLFLLFLVAVVVTTLALFSI